MSLEASALMSLRLSEWILILGLLLAIGCGVKFYTDGEDFWPPQGVRGWAVFMVKLPWVALQGFFWIALFVVASAFWTAVAVVGVVAVVAVVGWLFDAWS